MVLAAKPDDIKPMLSRIAMMVMCFNTGITAPAWCSDQPAEAGADLDVVVGHVRDQDAAS